MAILQFNNVGISALAACVPKHIVDNYKYTQYFPEEDVKKVVDKIAASYILESFLNNKN